MYHVDLAVTPEDRTKLRALLRYVAHEQCWQPGDWLEREQPRAAYLGLKVDSQWVGGLQLILPDQSGRLPSCVVWPEVVLTHPRQTAHVTVLGLLPMHRGTPVYFWALCIELWRICEKAGIGAVILEATPPMLARYQKLGWPLEVIGEERLHWGESCFLAHLEFDRVALTMLKQALRSPSYRTLVTQAVRSGRDIPCLLAAALP